ncbi:FUSC family protein [Actinokineospora iranica]|uniref:FUSC family protein n=1 Tax=Actinokineospora iranica TaxID=1271860 RepID=UPI0015876F10|nr:aromatic acid exporter family protein [Actinokineospora iranica]
MATVLLRRRPGREREYPGGAEAITVHPASVSARPDRVADHRQRRRRRESGIGSPPAVRASLTRPLRWLGRALRLSGYERLVVTQAAKAALAAALAWLVAADGLGLPQPFLAPFVAVFLVETTVYRSVLASGQQLVCNAIAVLAAAVADWCAPGPAAAIGVAAVLGLLIGRWPRLGDSGRWVGPTAVLVVALGTTADGFLLLDRLVETGIGAALATVVNAVVYPPAYGNSIASAARGLADESAALLTGLADELRRDEPPDDPSAWPRHARDIASRARVAELFAERAVEGRRLTPRLRRAHPTDAAIDESDRLRRAWSHVRDLADAVPKATAADVVYPGAASRRVFADALDDLASTVRSCGADTAARDRCAATLHKLSHATKESGPVLGLASLLLPARELLAVFRTDERKTLI